MPVPLTWRRVDHLTRADLDDLAAPATSNGGTVTMPPNCLVRSAMASGLVDRERDTPVRRHIIAELGAGHQLQPADRVGEPSGCASFAMTLAHAWIIPLEEVPVTRDAPQPARVTLVAVSSALSTEM